jgi:hypothetical protein
MGITGGSASTRTLKAFVTVLGFRGHCVGSADDTLISHQGTPKL